MGHAIPVPRTYTKLDGFVISNAACVALLRLQNYPMCRILSIKLCFARDMFFQKTIVRLFRQPLNFCDKGVVAIGQACMI